MLRVLLFYFCVCVNTMGMTTRPSFYTIWIYNYKITIHRSSTGRLFKINWVTHMQILDRFADR